MARDFAGIVDFLTRAAAGVGGNLTLSAHVNPDIASVRATIVEYVAVNNFALLEYSGIGQLYFYYRVGACLALPIVVGPAVGVWALHLGEHISVSANQTKVYYNATVASSTANCLLAANGAVSIGENGTGAGRFDGDMCHAAQWNAGLDAAEVQSLEMRVSPRRVRPSALKAYWEITGNNSPELDYIGRKSMTVMGGPTKSPERPMFRPLGVINVGVPGAVGPVTPGRNVQPLCPCCGHQSVSNGEPDQ